MRSRSNSRIWQWLRPGMAMLMLLFFVASQIKCFVHCNLGEADAPKGHACCAKAKDASQNANAVTKATASKSTGSNEDRIPISCSTMKAFLLGGNSVHTTLDAVPVPATLTAAYYFISSIVLEHLPTPAIPFGTGQQGQPDRLSTLEVCLDPALHSLAPPSLKA